ncbi:hydrophobin-251 [Armillaria novae-zelandiae]|uniref:Hydrophobin n=1 Tax=Armillaria novae-zelandiae TaxID=153914 RepID=A0AA39P4N4_9AGAR|nr:hydrophobin-251 [Armillaria novae-zelandiae]
MSAFSFAILALPLLAAASVVPRETTNTTVTGGQCNTGSAQCCKSVQDKLTISGNSPSLQQVQNALGVLGIPYWRHHCRSVGASLADPITVIGLGTTQCANQPVCCEKNNFNGLVALGCTPINIGL